jgi:hypothetical protein
MLCKGRKNTMKNYIRSKEKSLGSNMVHSAGKDKGLPLKISMLRSHS